MSVTSISGTTPAQTDDVQNNAKKIRNDVNQLQQALSSGSLDQAQQAFTTLQSDLPSGAANSPFGKALTSIGDALQSGDVSGAQQAFAAMQQQVKGGGHHHHHHRAETQPTQSPTQTPTTDGASPSTVGTLVNGVA